MERDAAHVALPVLDVRAMNRYPNFLERRFAPGDNPVPDPQEPLDAFKRCVLEYCVPPFITGISMTGTVVFSKWDTFGQWTI
jgi:hypothetical protein